MWRVNKLGKEQVWYEAELIEKIKQISLTNCLTCGECKNGFKFEQCGYNDILELILKENEK